MTNIEVWSVLDDIDKILKARNPEKAIEGELMCLEEWPSRFGTRMFNRKKLNRPYTPEQVKAILQFKESKK